MRLLDAFEDGEPRIEWLGETLGAEELRGRVGASARWMREQGLLPGDRVGLHLSHGADAPVFLLACWSAGLVAVPLDLHHPPDRLAALMERSGAKLFVTSGRRGAALARRVGGPAAVLDKEWSLGLDVAESVDLPPDAPALILWTSGSTGAPKGVTIPRRAVDSFVHWWGERLDVGPSDRLAWTAALSFDLSLLDIGVALSRGATLVPVPDARLAFPDTLGEYLDERGITCIYSVPSLLARVLDPMPPSLRVVLSAGEALSPGLAASLRASLGERGLLANLFGPTETNVSTAWFVPWGWDGGQVSIGAPCPYVEVRLGEDDEMLVRGETVMSGYWGEPARASWTEGWLHTGDRARWDDDGLVFLGRADRMVKVRGYRVEPEEVERQLESLSGVDSAAVVVVGQRESAELVAFAVGDFEEDLLSDLARVLPSWACPARIERLDELPRSPRGKVDRAALRASVGG
ncbi:MAG: AMP-binding protein [Deltaproteobacteria bacterium]|nr:AMP-binding protein [Deltaproteobacteria bacterium]